MTTEVKKFAIRATNLCKSVMIEKQPLVLLDAVNLDIHAGETVAVVGTSGSGKSTLLGLLAGLDTPTSGDVSLMGQDLNTLSEDQRAQLRGQHVGFVFQSFQLLPSLTALENVMLTLEVQGHKDAQQIASQKLDSVGLTARANHYPKQLSGGEQQRVALARAFAANPDILFADEPTGNLDRATGKHIEQRLFTMNADHNTTLVLVTHDENLASQCERIIRLEAGKITHATHTS